MTVLILLEPTKARGEGANFAIKDAVQLGKLLVESWTRTQPATSVESLRPKLDQFQKEIIDKGLEAIKISRVAYVRPGVRQPPMAWGYEMTELKELKPVKLGV